MVTSPDIIDVEPIESKRIIGSSFLRGRCPRCGSDNFVWCENPIKNQIEFYCRICGTAEYHDKYDIIDAEAILKDIFKNIFGGA